jgi:cytochrome b involved in lipid metabolism
MGPQICQEFNDIHSDAAHEMLKDYYIGQIMQHKHAEVRPHQSLDHNVT